MTAHLRHLLASTHLDAEGHAVVYADRLHDAIEATEAEEGHLIDQIGRLMADLSRRSGLSMAQMRAVEVESGDPLLGDLGDLSGREIGSQGVESASFEHPDPCDCGMTDEQHMADALGRAIDRTTFYQPRSDR